MVKTILSSIYHPPQIGANFFSREQCVEKLLKGQNKRLIFVKGGPGFGKTNLLAGYYQQLAKKKIWLTLPDTSFAYDSFLIHIFYGLLDFLEPSERPNWETIGGDMLRDYYDVNQIVSYLINLLLAINDEVYIFVDDLHLLPVNAVEKGFQSLQMFLRFVPEQVHFLVTSREEAPLLVNRFRLNNQILELTEEDLVFSPDEMKSFIEQVGLELNSSVFSWLSQVSEGWVAGICLAIYWAKELNHPLEERMHMTPLRDYLLEILWEIPEETRQFLLKTCIFKKISLDICNQYLQIENSQQILDKLVEHSLLTSRYEENGVSYYRYHNMLREYFSYHLDETTKNQYNLELAKVYRQMGMIEMEITHLIEAGEDQEATDLIKKEAPRILSSSDLNKLNEWLTVLASKGKTDDPLLDLYRGHICETQGHLEQAQAYYLKAEPGLWTAGDMDNWVTARTQIAGIYWWKESFKETLQICEETLPYVKPDDKSSLAGLYNLMASSAIALNERAKGIDYLLKARDFTHQAEDLNGEAWILNNLATVGYFPQGKLNEAAETYEESMKLFRAIKNKQGMALLLTNMGYLQLVMHDLQQADIYLDEAEKIYLEMNNVRSVRSVWILQANLQLALRNFNRAEPLLKKIEETLQKAEQVSNFQQGQFALAYSIYYREQEDITKAEEWMEVACKYMESCGDASYFLQEYRLQRVLLYIRSERYVNAIQEAEGIISDAMHEGFELVRMEANLLLAVAKKGDCGMIPPQLVKLLTGLDNGQYGFLKQKYAYFASEISEILPLANQQQMINLNVIEQPVRIYFFGEFVLFNQGKKISARDWSNRKALDLLKFLLLQHDHWVRQEDILENFWPESDVEKGKQTLYVALYTIRRTWEPQLQKSKDSQFIQTKRGMYRIQIPEPYWLDIEAFNDFTSEGMRLCRERRFVKAEQYLKEAKKIYTGDFLPENLYDEWTQTYREEYLQNYLQVLISLAGINGENGEFTAAVDLLYQALNKNQFHDQIHTMILKYLIKQGRVNEAIQHFREFNEMYQEELGVGMPDDIKALYQQLVG